MNNNLLIIGAGQYRAVVKSNTILRVGTKVESGTTFTETNITKIMSDNYYFEVGM